MTEDEVFDSPTGWVAKHITRYETSDGTYMGVPSLLLTTRGRRSGKLRRTALMYAEDDGRYLLVASNGGAATHPSWYLNLTENPEVEVQILTDRFPARAYTAVGDERERLWKIAAKGFPTYDKYLVTARNKGREIPLIVIERQ
jgi:deazaflavin-dependent oxidoreductase (nitroreductase family)